MPLLMKERTSTMVLEALAGLQPQSSAGSDGIHAAVYQRYASVFAPKMGELMDHVLQGAQLPEAWTEGLVRVVPKVPGSLLVSDMRPICLQNMLIKWMTAIVLRQLEDFFAAIIPKSQK